MGEDQYIRFGWREISVQSSTYFTRSFLQVMRIWYHHEQIYCFSRHEEMQRYNLSIKISNYLKTFPPDSLKHRVPHFTLNFLRGWWRSEEAAAQGQSPCWSKQQIAADSKYHCCCCLVISRRSWQVSVCSWYMYPIESPSFQGSMSQLFSKNLEKRNCILEVLTINIATKLSWKNISQW